MFTEKQKTSPPTTAKSAPSIPPVRSSADLTCKLPTCRKASASNWKLFLELGLYNEWIGRTKVKFADTRLTTSDLSGLGFEASLGFNAAVAENAYCYGAVTHWKPAKPIPHTS